MALVYVGGTSGVGTTATYAISLSGTLTGGIASSPSQDDIVVVFSGFGNTAAVAPTCSGNNSGAYAFVTGTTSYHQNDTWDAEFAGRYAIQGATVDTSLTIGRTNNAAYGGATVVQVWRGVDTTTPFDVTATVAGAGNTSLVNPPLITPTTAGAVILAGGTGTQTTAGSAFVVSSNMTGPSVTTFDNGTTSDTGTCIASHEWTSGSFTPNAVTGGTTSTSSAWRAMTLALRPAPPNDYPTTAQAGAYALTGQSATVTRSKALSATAGSYTLSGVSATLSYVPLVVGYELTALAGSYSLTGQAATVSRNKALLANAGSYTLSGVNAVLKKSKLITANAGSYTLAGQSALLSYGASYALTANAGAYVLTGVNATLTYTVAGVYELTALAGSYTLTGGAATLSYSTGQVVGRRWTTSGKAYLKQDNEILVFPSEDAKEDYLKAQEQAKQAINRAQRRAVIATQPKPIKVDLTAIEAQAEQFEFESIQPLIVENNFQRILEIHLAIQQMIDEDDIEILLLA